MSSEVLYVTKHSSKVRRFITAIKNKLFDLCRIGDSPKRARHKKETLSYRARGIILLMIQNLQLFLIMSFYSLASVPGPLYGIKKAYEVYFLVPDESINNRNSCICGFTDPQLRVSLHVQRSCRAFPIQSTSNCILLVH